MCTDKLRERGLGVAWDLWNGKDILLGAGVARDLQREVDTGGRPLYGVGLGLWNGEDTISTVGGQLSVKRSLTDSSLRTTKVGGHIE